MAALLVCVMYHAPSWVVPVLVTYCRVGTGRGHNYIGLLCWQQLVSRYLSPGETIHLTPSPASPSPSSAPPRRCGWGRGRGGFLLVSILPSDCYAVYCLCTKPRRQIPARLITLVPATADEETRWPLV